MPHWGLVLDGDVVNHWQDQELELWGPGDVFHCPGGPPGHRMEVADRAIVIDYTPIESLDDPALRRAPRTSRTYASPVAKGSATVPQEPGAASPRARSRLETDGAPVG